jgi:SAM-dependent methyltransferase
VSVHLARRFRKVYALDVSPGNLATAKKNAEVYGNDNINFKLITKIRDYERVPSFDFFFSLIVLQHNPPPVQRYMLERIAAKAKPGALFYFQVQAYAEKYDFDPNTYLDSPDHQMEMHVFPQSAVFDVLRTARCKILDVMEDNPTNHPNWMSMAFLAQKAPR